MIVKTLRWKTQGFNRLIDYIGKEGREETETFRVLHNLRRSPDLTGIARQFWANDAYRKERKNGVVLYHEILSFKRGEEVPLEAVEDLTRKYLELRAPNALAYAEPHFDQDHLHVHLCISGTEFRSAKTLRLNNEKFMQVRRDIERYQREHYPELQSLVYDSRKKKRIEELEAVREARALRDREPEGHCIEPEGSATSHSVEMEQTAPPHPEESYRAQRQAELDAVQNATRLRLDQEREGG